jgi:hypothetical protein
MRAESPSVYGPVRRLWLREARPRVESRRAGALSRRRPQKPQPEGAEFPTIADGVKGTAFMEAAVESSKANGKWVKPAKV